MLASDYGPGALLAGDSREYRLGKLIAEGGEGVVYFVQNRDDVVAKLYKEWEYGRDEKLRHLIAVGGRRLRRVAAIPLSRLNDDQDRTVGFVMESLDGWQPLHAAYQIRSRLKHAPNRTWAYLVRVARNLATCVHHVHENGLVVGDLNESNVLVGPDAMVKLIDTDSFQLEAEGKLYPCKVGKAELIPPELQGRSLDGIVRTPDHDRFSLATLIFQTLVFGRHPFAGRPKTDDDLPVEEAIANGWYVYTERRTVPILPPPHLTLQWLPREVRDLFERAFDPGEVSRPTAKEWYSALKDVEASLGGCSVNGSHVYWKDHGPCPWCNLEERWNILLFRPAALDPLSSADFDVEAVWRKIASLPVPKVEHEVSPIDYHKLPPARISLPRLAVLKVAGSSTSFFWPIYAALLFGKDVLSWGALGVALVALFAVIFVYLWTSVERIRGKVRKANGKLEALGKIWETDADPDVFLAKLAEMNSIREALTSNAARYEEARQARIRELHQDDLRRYLQKYSIYAADVTNFQKPEFTKLHSRGIETAADITPQNRTKRGKDDDRLWDDLTRWRQALENQFWNASTFGLPSHEERSILERIHREDVAMRRKLLSGETELTELAERLRVSQTDLLEKAEPYRRVVLHHGPVLAALEGNR